MYSSSCKKSGRVLPVFIALVLLANVVNAEVVVIVHPENKALIDKSTLKKIFMGRTKTFPDGEKAVPIDIEAGEVKAVFMKQFLQKEQGALDAYWSRMLFTGGGTPPKAFKSEEEVKKLVASNRNFIGYIEKSKLDKTVRMIDLNQAGP